MRRTICFFFTLITFTLFAQKPVTLKIDKSVSANETVEIHSYYKGKSKLLTSVKADGKDSIIISDFSSPGLYMISLKGYKNQAEFIYNPNEAMIIEMDMTLRNGQIGISQSKENTCYSDLLKINNVYDHFLDSVQSVRRDLHITTADFYGRCFFIDSVYETVAQEKNGRLTYLQFNYPGTFTSEVLVPLNLIPVANFAEKSKYQTPDAYLANFYFKYVAPDKRLLYHYGVEDAVMNFLSKYSYPEMNGIKKSIDYITHTFEKDTAVNNYVSSFLIKTFLDAKSPELALYVMGEAGEGCSFDLGEKQADYLNNYTHVQLGKQVDDIILNDINGQPVSLSNTCKKSELTILLFWTSWCTHCQKNLPELKSLVASYKNKVQVFAVSLDEKQNEWTDFVNSKELQSWVHVSELKEISKSTLAPRFMVTHTPTLFLLDKSRTILARNLDGEELKQELNTRIK